MYSGFQSFSNLPRELRDQIWGLVLPVPRIIEIRFIDLPFHLPSPKIPTPLLHVCQESRAKVLETYMSLYCLSSTLPTIYINPKIDTLFINEYMHQYDKVFQEFDERIFGSLKYLAVESERLLWHPNYSKVAMKKLPVLANLKTVTMVLPATEPDARPIIFLDVFQGPIQQWLSPLTNHDHENYMKRIGQLSEEAKLNLKNYLRSSQSFHRGCIWISEALADVTRDYPDWKVPTFDIKAVERLPPRGGLLSNSH